MTTENADLAQQLEGLLIALDDELMPPRPALPESLFHYTDAAGLQGILKSRQIWATDCRYLNDREEMQVGRRHFCQVARDFAPDRSEQQRRFIELVISEYERAPIASRLVPCIAPFRRQAIFSRSGVHTQRRALAIPLDSHPFTGYDLMRTR
jgi:hypothetical protein